MAKTFWTSDIHKGHSRIIELCGRPFSSSEDMDAEIVRRFNAKVTPEDTVIHLGDFALGDKTEIPGFRRKLNGRWIFVLGNHDKNKRGEILPALEAALLPGDQVKSDILWWSAGARPLGASGPRTADDQGGIIVHGAHIPSAASFDDGRGYTRPDSLPGVEVAFCGHVHTSWLIGADGTINVGVDRWGFAPHTFEEIMQKVGRWPV